MNEIVTIGLCVKNSEKTIQNLFSSLIAQEFPLENTQVIVVDGCSSDNTISSMTKAADGSDLKVKIFSDEGKGLGYARQMVVAKSIGSYIFFVDSDVTLFNDFVFEQVKFMDENPKVGVAFAKPMFQKGPLVSEVLSLFNYAEECMRGSTATIFRTVAITQVGGFDTSIKGAAEDIDLIRRIQAKGWLVSANKKAKFFHKYKENLHEFWLEQTWFGYGSHYVSHKNVSADPAWRNLPIGYFFFSVRTASKAYKMTLQKISFLIPLQMVLGNISWWLGFIQAHIDGYGHRIER